MLLANYSAYTPGTQSLNNTSVILSQDDQVQPDTLLRILPAFKGQTVDTQMVVKGPPELVAEISFSSRAIDLHVKKDRYEKFGVKEYLVSCLEPRELYWFDFANRCRILPTESGNYCSVVFPGLWIDHDAMLSRNRKAALDCLIQGLQSAEHLDFVAHLARKRL